MHRSEPYVYAQMIAGKDAPTHGEAKNSWLTGTAAWNFVAITQWILGIRPELTGCASTRCCPRRGPASPPPGSSGARPTRSRCARRPGSTGRVAYLLVDGERVDGTVVPPAAPGAVVLVEAVIAG